MLDPLHHYFPDADSPFFAPFAAAFLRMMFAHANFEARIRDLQSAVSGDDTFGELPENQWPARERAKRMSKLIQKHFGDIAEVNPIRQCLRRSVSPSDTRNLLVHGAWWRYVPEAKAITVHSGTTRRPNKSPEQRDVTVADIDKITSAFADLEVELWRLQRDIEKR